MCGRFNLTSPGEIEERFGFVDWHERRVGWQEPLFNISPSQQILTIVQASGRAPVPQQARWGLVPYWMQSGSKRPPPINARAETLAESPLFRGALATGRCLIPATAFFEWTARPGRKGKIPVHVRLKDGEVFAFAGLWLPGKAGSPPTAAIVTTRPNELLGSIHTRMPAILQPDEEQLWLDPEVTVAEAVLPLLKPYPADLMEAWTLEDTADVREFDRDPELAARALRLADSTTRADIGGPAANGAPHLDPRR
jgi:putative SOS response-associated peptidase YedK